MAGENLYRFVNGDTASPLKWHKEISYHFGSHGEISYHFRSYGEIYFLLGWGREISYHLWSHGEIYFLLGWSREISYRFGWHWDIFHIEIFFTALRGHWWHSYFTIFHSKMRFFTAFLLALWCLTFLTTLGGITRLLTTLGGVHQEGDSQVIHRLHIVPLAAAEGTSNRLVIPLSNGLLELSCQS